MAFDWGMAMVAMVPGPAKPAKPLVLWRLPAAAGGV